MENICFNMLSVFSKFEAEMIQSIRTCSEGCQSTDMQERDIPQYPIQPETHLEQQRPTTYVEALSWANFLSISSQTSANPTQLPAYITKAVINPLEWSLSILWDGRDDTEVLYSSSCTLSFQLNMKWHAAGVRDCMAQYTRWGILSPNLKQRSYEFERALYALYELQHRATSTLVKYLIDLNELSLCPRTGVG